VRRVLVYVEGPSDKAAMSALLQPLIEQKMQEGVWIEFFEATGGDRKKAVLLDVPRRAATLVAYQPDVIVVALPDLYPRNKGFTHETFAEMRDGIYKAFDTVLKSKIGDDPRSRERFKVFCFKYDLEALLLAAKDALEARLNIDSLNPTWVIPVEDQNHEEPPKRIVEHLFEKHGERYIDTVDAPLILSLADYQEIAEACPQCFKPFVDFLTSLVGE
jgi:hypothetical protein